ncbi:HEAT repeat domain-containing protein [Streptomyces sp. NPDC059447]|uniref:HEAT repeat domain-containing protein n=1 Tax=Streptomyces sp. NPDC059447 TaxID=3346834 RepID=UPI0036C24296
MKEQRPGPGRDPWAFLGDFTELAPAFTAATQAMSGVGEHAEERYQAALGELRAKPQGDLVALVRRGWDSLPRAAYIERWGLVQLLTDLRLSSASELLGDMVATPIPHEHGHGQEHGHEHDHRFPPTVREVILRTTAVEGLVRLAGEGDGRAVELLAQHVDHDERAVRVACIIALRELGDQAGVDVTGLVAEPDREVLGFQVTDLEDVRRIDRVDHVLHPGNAEGSQPEPQSPPPYGR